MELVAIIVVRLFRAKRIARERGLQGQRSDLLSNSSQTGTRDLAKCPRKHQCEVHEDFVCSIPEWRERGQRVANFHLVLGPLVAPMLVMPASFGMQTGG